MPRDASAAGLRLAASAARSGLLGALLHEWVLLPYCQRFVELRDVQQVWQSGKEMCGEWWISVEVSFLIAIAHSVLYFGVAGLFFHVICDMIGCSRHERSAGANAAHPSVWKVVSAWCWSSYIVQPLELLFIVPLMLLAGMKAQLDATTGFWWVAWQVAWQMVLHDAIFYHCHRQLHTRAFYRWHKDHHSVVGSYALAAEYASDAESFLGHNLPVFVPAMLLSLLGDCVSFAAFLSWISVRLIHSYAIHSGYELPWLVGALMMQSSGADAHHENHHTKNNGNFGDSPLWDILMGTCNPGWASAAGVGIDACRAAPSVCHARLRSRSSAKRLWGRVRMTLRKEFKVSGDRYQRFRAMSVECLLAEAPSAAALPSPPDLSSPVSAESPVSVIDGLSGRTGRRVAFAEKPILIEADSRPNAPDGSARGKPASTPDSSARGKPASTPDGSARDKPTSTPDGSARDKPTSAAWRGGALAAVVAALLVAGAFRSTLPHGQSAYPIRRLFPEEAEGCASRGFVAIVGAGPAGLATAARLQQARVPFVVFEREVTAGHSWRTRYPRLHLHTVGASSQLPGWPFPDHFPEYVSASDLAAYYDGYARTVLAPHVRYNATVTSAKPAADGKGWSLRVSIRTADGAVQWRRYEAAALVVATGQEGAPVIPPIEGRESFEGESMHSAAWRGGAKYAGKKALVVGFGNSGAEVALDLWEQGAAGVTVTARSPIHVLPRWLFSLYPHGMRSLLYFERFLAPIWLSDAVGGLLQRLLYSDLPSAGLQLSRAGVKSELLRHHRAPLLDIGTIELVRRGEISVEGRRLARLTRRGALLCETTTPADGAEGTAEVCEEAPYDLVVFATGYSKASAAAPHARFLPADLLPRLASAWGQIESGREVAPALWFAGFSDIVGRLAEINWEAAAIAKAIAKDHVEPQPAAAPARSYASLHRAAWTPAVCEEPAREGERVEAGERGGS